MATPCTARRAAAALAVVAALTGCAATRARRPPAAAPAPVPAVIATAGTGALAVYSAPGGHRPTRTLSPRTGYGSPRALLVLGQRGSWLRVLLPERPDGSQGWIRRDAVSLRRTPYRVVVSLSHHTLSLYDGSTRVLSAAVATGARRTPTPRGRFYVTDVVRVGSGAPWFGPYALGLSGHSPVLTSFAGGDGQVALHGTDHPELVGRAVSHGCVRLPNAIVTRLARTVPLGTPVTITA